MDRQNENGLGFFTGIKASFNREAERRRGNGMLFVSDLLVFFLAFIFARCHFVFGAYPLAIAFVSVLKSGVWLGVMGAVLGAFSLGKTGVIYAVISLVTLFLRMIISGGSKGDKKLFSESLALKISSAGVAALIGGIYQMLLDGFSTQSILFSLFGVSLTCGFTFIFSGIYLSNISVSDVLFSKKTIFTRKSFKSDKEKLDLILYSASLLAFVYVVGAALAEYELLGISASYVYSGFLTLFVAKRFGTARAMTVGFVSSVSVSGIYAVSFAFAGLGAGIFFSFGTYYAIIAAAALLSLYAYYVGNIDGLVSTFPEFAIAAVLFLPSVRYLAKEKEQTSLSNESKTAERMVNIASLSYKNKGMRDSRDSSVSSLRSLAKVIFSGGKNEGKVSYGAYRDSVVYSVREHCLSCPNFDVCSSQSPAPCAENIDLIAEKLANKERLFVDDINLFPKYCDNKSELYERVIAGAEELENNAKKNCRMTIRSKDYELVCRALEESYLQSERELCLDTKLSLEVEKLLEEFGVGEPNAKIFGTRKRHVILAGIDSGGKILTSKELKEQIEKKLGARLSDGEFYKKDSYILCEFDETEKIDPSLAISFTTKSGESVSGDSIASFKGEDGKFYVLLSDGEGSGAKAKEISSLACDYLSHILVSPVSKSTAISALNHVLKNMEGERSATIDLFELDLYTGEGVFYKCGAVSSYIKRADSIFKVRSQSAPIGLMSTIDAESIRVDVKQGDCVVLLSDGVLPENEDTTWFLELVNRESVRDVKEYSDMLLSNAKKKTDAKDDMSVAVIKINEKTSA